MWFVYSVAKNLYELYCGKGLVLKLQDHLDIGTSYFDSDL